MAREPITITPGVGRRIRDRRDELGLTVDQAVAKTGGTPRQAAWHNIERGDGRFSVRTVRGVCRALGWTPDSIERLVTGEDPIVTVATAVPVISVDPPLEPSPESWFSQFLEDQVRAQLSPIRELLDSLAQRVEELEALQHR